LVLAILVIGAGAGLYASRDPLSEHLRAWLAPGSNVQLAGVPQPRKAPAKASDADETHDRAADLAEMPALIATDAAAPETWPALTPADLLGQSGALGDRSLKDIAFDQPPSRRFARPFTPASGRPLLGLLVTGLGTDRAVTAAAIAGLPAEVSLSFSPYAADLADWIAASRAFGHEAMVDLPLQSKDFPKRDPGPLGLLVALNASEAGRRIDAIAQSAPGAFGFAGDGGDALLLDDDAAGIVLRETARLGLAFIDTSGEPMSLALPAARDAGLAATRSAIALDRRPSRTAIAERLSAAVQLAQKQGSVLAVARASPLAITAIAEGLRRLGDQDPLPAPASALLQR